MSEYPDKAELKKIEKWDSQDPWGLAEYLMSVWHFNDYIRIGKRWEKGGYEGGHKVLRISTAGWSGNEDRIEALRKNMFWFFYWQSSKRGGHFIFHLPRFHHHKYKKK